MLITTATLTEASPIIEALGLKAVQKKPFLQFQRDSILLAITGIGALNAAAAVGYIVAQPLLNIGICAGSEVGKLYNIHKVIDGCSHKSYLLQKDPSLPNAPLRTLPQPAQKEFKELVDMEAAGIVVAARRFGIMPKIVKIVSDTYKPQLLTQEYVRKLMQHNLQQLLDIIADLNA